MKYFCLANFKPTNEKYIMTKISLHNHYKNDECSGKNLVYKVSENRILKYNKQHTAYGKSCKICADFDVKNIREKDTNEFIEINDKIFKTAPKKKLMNSSLVDILSSQLIFY